MTVLASQGEWAIATADSWKPSAHIVPCSNDPPQFHSWIRTAPTYYGTVWNLEPVSYLLGSYNYLLGIGRRRDLKKAGPRILIARRGMTPAALRKLADELGEVIGTSRPNDIQRRVRGEKAELVVTAIPQNRWRIKNLTMPVGYLNLRRGGKTRQVIDKLGAQLVVTAARPVDWSPRLPVPIVHVGGRP